MLEAHSRGALHPGWRSQGGGGRQGHGEMGFSSEERGEGESFPGRGKACAKVQEAGVEGCLYSWNTASRQEGQEETEKASRGPDHKVFLEITLRNLDFALRILESWEKVLSRKFYKVS